MSRCFWMSSIVNLKQIQSVIFQYKFDELVHEYACMLQSMHQMANLMCIYPGIHANMCPAWCGSHSQALLSHFRLVTQLHHLILAAILDTVTSKLVYTNWTFHGSQMEFDSVILDISNYTNRHENGSWPVINTRLNEVNYHGLYANNSWLGFKYTPNGINNSARLYRSMTQMYKAKS